MDKVYDHKKVEDKLYSQWEGGGYFKPEINKEAFESSDPKTKFTIVLPPPNANGNLHFGHAMMSLEDIMIRYNRMKGRAALFVPGADHAGFETQFVFERKLQEDGKSRFDYDRDTLYQMIWDYVQQNKSNMENQLKKLGFSLDWSREKFTLDPDIVKVVYKTFKKLFDDDLVYRGNRLVNYCTKDGTSFSDLETVSEEKEGSLYFIKYPIKDGGSITVATTRPETMFGDTAVMVNPKDARYKDMIGKTVLLPLTDREIPIIADESVEMEFGTGAVKVTPGHDFNDFEVGRRHGLSLIQVIGFDGKMEGTNIVDGLYVKQARPKVVELLKEKELLEKGEKHQMIIKTCYKCKTVLEPLPLEQWYIKVRPLADRAIDVVKKGEIKIFPKNLETLYFQWLENLNDWNISRQIVWGIRIPAWRKKGTNEWVVTEGEKPEGEDWEQDEDTFDTWFSSGQWPFATLMTTKPGDFEKFYPTSVMETGYDILKAWVSRMVMLGLYATNKVPFHTVVLHGLVNDPYGKKMSKSKGNVINPLELVEEYGADAVRFALVYENATGNDQALSYPKLDAARKFTNKLWNMARFIEMKQNELETGLQEPNDVQIHNVDKEWVEKAESLTNEVSKYLDNYQFNLAAERLYEFIWHEFADHYIENIKDRIDIHSLFMLRRTFFVVLRLLHPFMPFVTEELYQQLKLGDKMLIIEHWPK